jgi:hypothetical protein
MPGLDNFTPTVWARSLLSPFYKALVYGSLVNRDYEGEISSYGDSVKINEIGDISISDYSKFVNTGSTSTALSWQALTSAQKMLYIDHAKSFSFAVDDVDMVQNNPKVMAEAMSRAAYALADEVDQDIAEAIGDNSGNIITAMTVSSATVLTLISQMARELDENNVPASERFLIVPPFIHQDLVESFSGGISSTAVPKVFNDSVLMNGFVGNVYGFNVLMSNNCPLTSSTSIVTAFHRSAVTFAGQLSKIMPVSREDYFDQGVKGLYLYGFKVIRPSGIATCAVTEG